MTLAHPEIRMPLWAAVAIPAAAYVVRSVARGMDFTPDLPTDAIVFGGLAVLVLAVWLARRTAPHQGDDRSTQKVDRDDGETG